MTSQAVPLPPPAPPSPDSSTRQLLQMGLLLAAAYIICGKLSLLLAIPPGYASAIFPPAGIAVAAAFIAGRRALPGILLGSFLLNLWIGYDSSQQLSLIGCGAALLIALASLLQAMFGGKLLRRVIGYPAAFDNLRDILCFQLLSPLICLLSATLSVGCLLLLGLVPAGNALPSWFMWWVGDTLGVLVLLPLTMVVAGAPRRLWRKRLGTVAVPMLFAFSMLVVLYVNVSRWEQTESMLEFQLQSQRLADTIQARLDEQESLLAQTKGLFAGDDEVTADEFRRFSQEALARFPMIQAMEWAPRITLAQRAQFEAAQQARLPGFRVRERDRRNVLHLAAPRSLYYPITYVEPASGNQPALGFDVHSTAARAATVQLAIASGRSVATPPLRLVQAPQSPYGFLLLHAVKTVRGEDGLVLTVIRIDAFVKKLLPHGKTELKLRLRDTGSAQVVYNTFLQPRQPASWQQRLRFGQRELLFETTPGPDYLAQHRGWQSAAVLAAGILGTGLLGAFLMLGTGYTARVEAQVEEKVAELTESSEKLTGLYALSPLGIALTDLNGRFLDFNAAFQRICGYPAEELQALDYWTLTPRQYQQDEARQLQQLLSQGRYGPYEKEYRRKDGSLVSISLNGLLLRGRNGEQYIWSIVEDITERKRAEEALRDSEERWKFALEGAGDGLWDWNMQTGELFLSTQELAILGYPGDPQATSIEVWAKRQHPQDQLVRQQAIADYLAGNAPVYSYEFRTRTRDGRWKWILARGMLVSRLPDGSPLRMIGTHSDIDARKRKQEQEAIRSAVMEMLARGGKLNDVLDKIIASLETDNQELSYAIFSHDGDGGAALAGTSLPALWYPPLPELAMPGDGAAPLPARPLAGNATAGLEVCCSAAIISGEATVEGVLVSFRKHAGSQALPDQEQQREAANLISIAMQHKRIEEQLLLANSVYETIDEAIMVVDADKRILAVNPAFERITGFRAHEIIGHDPQLMRSASQPEAFYQEVWHTILATGSWHGEMWYQRKNGSSYPLTMSVNTIHDDAGQVLRRIAAFSDITAKKLAEEQIHYLAHHDLLTKLPNRALYADRLSLALATARRNQSQLALLYIDLDNFKPVNDTLGHAVGDKLLKLVARRMQDCVRESDTIARLGGDEFVAILPAIHGELAARQVAEKIRAALAETFAIDGHPIVISSSIGGALYPAAGDDESKLMLNADAAMYSAKKSGRNRVHFYQPDA
ncbi:PAS domain S-box protein [Vogesella facilis]|uniref:PAS domain S-box protein n=1 Tax=Vogesella facilis TaxID=1655232 RepID=A0ABV7RGE7_9NEIS